MNATRDARSDERGPFGGLPVGRRVLVAEDDAALSEVFAVVLRERGYQVATVSTGIELGRVSNRPRLGFTAPHSQKFGLGGWALRKLVSVVFLFGGRHGTRVRECGARS